MAGLRVLRGVEGRTAQDSPQGTCCRGLRPAGAAGPAVPAAGKGDLARVVEGGQPPEAARPISEREMHQTTGLGTDSRVSWMGAYPLGAVQHLCARVYGQGGNYPSSPCVFATRRQRLQASPPKPAMPELSRASVPGSGTEALTGSAR